MCNYGLVNTIQLPCLLEDVVSLIKRVDFPGILLVHKSSDGTVPSLLI